MIFGILKTTWFMDPETLLEKLAKLQTQNVDMIEFSKLEICQSQAFYNSLLLILTGNIPNITNNQKLLVISFMKEAKIHFADQKDMLQVIPLLDNTDLRTLLAKFIVSCFSSLDAFIQFFDPIAEISPSSFLLVFATLLENLPEDSNISLFIEKSVNILGSYLNHPEIELKHKIESVKCLRSLTRSFKSPEILKMISLILFTVFRQISVCDETMPIFFECLQLRHLFESVDDTSFYTKLQELCIFLVQRGPPNDIEDCSLVYYICHSIFRLFELHKDDFISFLQIPLDNLFSILFLFSVYHSDKILAWEDDIEEFYQDNEFHFSPFNAISDDEYHYEDDDDDSNSIYKEPYELQMFIFDGLKTISSIQIDPTTNIGSIIISVCQSLIGSEHSHFATEAINMSVITFFHKIEEVIQFDIDIFIQTSNDIGKLYFLKYCCKNQISFNDLSTKLEYLLGRESYIFRFLVASVLLNTSTDVVKPVLYSMCFVSCLKYLSVFETENVSGIINVLRALVDVVHKPAIIHGFAHQMTAILPSLLNYLNNFQHAFRTTSTLCALIARFIQFPAFKQQLIPFTLKFIVEVCSDEKGEICLRLHKSILDSFSNEYLSDATNLLPMYELFLKNLSLVPFSYIIQNPSIVPTILSISFKFIRLGTINAIDEYIFNLLASDEIPNRYFDRIAPLCISLMKNDSSEFRFHIFQLLIQRSELLSGRDNQNELLLPAIAVFVSIGIEQPQSFESIIMGLEYDFTTLMTTIKNHFSLEYSPLDIRLFIVFFYLFGDVQVLVDQQNTTIPLSLLNQAFAVNFFEHIINLYINNHLIDLYYSKIFKKDDPIYHHRLISCTYLDFVTMILQEKEFDEKKIKFSQFFSQEHL